MNGNSDPFQLPVRIAVSKLPPSGVTLALVLVASIVVGALIGGVASEDMSPSLVLTTAAACSAIDISLLGLCSSFQKTFLDRLDSADKPDKSGVTMIMRRANIALMEYLDKFILRLVQSVFLFVVPGLIMLAFLSTFHGSGIILTSLSSYCLFGAASIAFESLSYVRLSQVFLAPKLIAPVHDKDGSDYIMVWWL